MSKIRFPVKGNIQFTYPTGEEKMQYEEITSGMIEKYFKDKGLDVRVQMDYDPVYRRETITLNPRIYFNLKLSDESMYDDSSDIIKAHLDSLVKNIKDYYCKVLELGNTRVYPNRNLDKYCIVYNPDKVDIDMINKIVVALEL